MAIVFIIAGVIAVVVTITVAAAAVVAVVTTAVAVASSEVASCPLLHWYFAKLSWNVQFRGYQYLFHLEKIFYQLGTTFFNLLHPSISLSI
jgi:hypothetical protein